MIIHFYLTFSHKKKKKTRRNPSRVIIVDKTVAPGSEFNTILVPKWHGDLEDRSLLYIMQFLEHLVVDNVPDFRQEVLDNGGASHRRCGSARRSRTQRNLPECAECSEQGERAGREVKKNKVNENGRKG